MQHEKQDGPMSKSDALAKGVDEFIELLHKPQVNRMGVLADDPERTHMGYDQMVEMIARAYEPELVAKLDEAVKDITFWYA